jgi:hypothetical protein
MKTNLQSLTAARPLPRNTIAALFACVFTACFPTTAGPVYQSVQTLAQEGVFPVNGLAGDAFGQVVAFNKDFLFVSSPGSQPDGKAIAGAVFVYRKGTSGYEQTQVITTGGTGDHLGMLQILAGGDWLILGAIGTPIGPQVNDAISDQDFKGSVRIYRNNQANGQWELTQVLDSSSPGLSDLDAIENGGIPVLETEQGADFGLRMALDAEHGWLFVAALYQKGVGSANQPVINAGKVFAFQFDPSAAVWRLAQSFTSPDGAVENDGFGAAVAVKGRFAMISNGPVFQGPHPGNSSVYVYKLDQANWSYQQRLTGTQQTLTPLFFPQFSSATLRLGDSFGNAIALDENDAVITAPLETVEGGPVFTGAAYFFTRKNVGGAERWVLVQRVESDDPNSLAFGAFSVALEQNIAVISDLGRTGPAGPFQGAAHVYQRRSDAWERITILTDPAATPSAGFGSGVAIGGGRMAIGSSPFLGFFVPVIFRPPPAAAPPVAPGKVILYDRASE